MYVYVCIYMSPSVLTKAMILYVQIHLMIKHIYYLHDELKQDDI